MNDFVFTGLPQSFLDVRYFWVNRTLSDLFGCQVTLVRRNLVEIFGIMIRSDLGSTGPFHNFSSYAVGMGSLLTKKFYHIEPRCCPTARRCALLLARSELFLISFSFVRETAKRNTWSFFAVKMLES